MKFDADVLRPFIKPLIAPFLGALLTYLANRYGIIYTPEQAAQISDGVVAAILAIFAVAASATGVVGVLINKKANPANAATSQLAVAGKQMNEDERRLQESTKEYQARIGK
jgi:uncharacterized protein (DUF697 family)